MSLFRLTFRVVICPQFDIQSHHVFFLFNVQSRIFIRRLEPHLQFQRSEQSFVLSSTFRAIISLFHLTFRFAFSFWCSKPYLQFGVQSRHLSLVRHSEPLVNLAFRATIFLQFSIQSHIPSIQSCLSLLVRCSEPHCQHLGLPFSFSLVFRVILTIWSHFHQFQAFRVMSSVWHLEPSSSSV